MSASYSPKGGIGLVTIKVMISTRITNNFLYNNFLYNWYKIIIFNYILNLGCLFSSETLNMCIYLLFLKWFCFLG